MNQSMGKKNGFSRFLLYLSTPPPCAPSHPAACLWSAVGAARGTGQGTVYFKWGDMGNVGLLFTWLSHIQMCARRCCTAAKSTGLKADFCPFWGLVSDWGECNISFFTHTLHVSRGGDFVTWGKNRLTHPSAISVMTTGLSMEVKSRAPAFSDGLINRQRRLSSDVA